MAETKKGNKIVAVPGYTRKQAGKMVACVGATAAPAGAGPGELSAVTALAALLDATVTGTEMVRPPPFLLSTLLGAWNLPLRLLWTVILGLLLLARGRR